MAVPSALSVVGGIVLRFAVAGPGAPYVRCTEGVGRFERYNLPSQRKLAAQWVEARLDSASDLAAAYAALDYFERLAEIVREGARV